MTERTAEEILQFTFQHLEKVLNGARKEKFGCQDKGGSPPDGPGGQMKKAGPDSNAVENGPDGGTN